MKSIIYLSVFVFAYGCMRVANNDSKYTIPLSNVKTIDIVPLEPHVLRVDQAQPITTEEFQKRIKSIDYVPLDFSEPLGGIDKMIVTADKIFILDAFIAQKILVFSRDGKLQFKIDHKGRGPQEYLSLWDMQVDTVQHEIFVDDPMSRSYFYFSSIDGQFIRREKGVANCYAARRFGKYVNLLNNGQDFNEQENWPILITNQDSVLFKGFQFKPIQEGNYIVNSLGNDFDGNLLYTPINSDTVYQFLSDSTAFPNYVISQDKSIWKLNEEKLSEQEICELIKKSHYTRFRGTLLATESYIFFSVQHGQNEYITNKPHFWDQKTTRSTNGM